MIGNPYESPREQGAKPSRVRHVAWMNTAHSINNATCIGLAVYWAFVFSDNRRVSTALMSAMMLVVAAVGVSVNRWRILCLEKELPASEVRE